MTRSLAISFSLCLALAGSAAGQAAVEAGLGAARAVTSTAPAKGIGKSMSGISGALDKAFKPGQQPSNESPLSATKAPLPSATKAPAPVWEDADGIETGLSYQDLVRRFGPPIMSITNNVDRSLTYRGKEGMFQLEVRDGVVASIAKPQS
jgi:hypothetical protein